MVAEEEEGAVVAEEVVPLDEVEEVHQAVGAEVHQAVDLVVVVEEAAPPAVEGLVVEDLAEEGEVETVGNLFGLLENLLERVCVRFFIFIFTLV